MRLGKKKEDDAEDLQKLAEASAGPVNYAADDPDLRALLKQLDAVPNMPAPLAMGPSAGAVEETPPGAGPVVVFSEPNPAGAVFTIKIGGTPRYQVIARAALELLQEGGNAPPPPPPTTLTITQLSGGGTVLPGATVPLTITLSGPAPAPLTVNLSSSDPSVVALPSASGGVIPFNAGTTSAQTSCQAMRAGQAMITATLGQSSKQVQVNVASVPPPPPPIPGAINVRDHGAKGDGSADDYAACQAAIHKHGVTAAGTGPFVVYFPAGRYRMSRKLQIMGQHDIHLVGDSPEAAVIVAPGIDGVQIGRQDNCAVKKLGFEGIIGRTHKDGGNDGHGVTLEGSRNAVIEDVIVRWQGMAVAAFAGAVGATLTNVRAQGWATVAFFMGAGWKVRNCVAYQEDSNLWGQRSGHGVYIPSAASDVDVDGLTIENARLYALQVYGEVQGAVQRNIALERLKILNCANGLVTARETGAADLENFELSDFEITGTYQGHGLALRKCNGGVVQNGRVIGPSSVATESAGIMLGVWAGYEPNQYLKDLTIRNVAVEGWQKGFWAMQSNGGTFENVRVENAGLFRNNRVGNVILEPWLGQVVEGVTITE